MVLVLVVVVLVVIFIYVLLYIIISWQYYIKTIVINSFYTIPIIVLPSLLYIGCRPMGETKYFSVLPRLVNLLNVVSENPSHTHAQENIVVRRFMKLNKTWSMKLLETCVCCLIELIPFLIIYCMEFVFVSV